jgi:hypothetical protein
MSYQCAGSHVRASQFDPNGQSEVVQKKNLNDESICRVRPCGVRFHVYLSIYLSYYIQSAQSRAAIDNCMHVCDRR